MVMDEQGRRVKGRPKQLWMDNIKDDLIEKGLSDKDAQYRLLGEQRFYLLLHITSSIVCTKDLLKLQSSTVNT